ncbi:DUF554 domain-containing protein [Serpentinicella sp. ANB-PHB4]|uniref:DUF554 domain-containing protein n=1 Tax=Serpentinicella sp. ANB-PHB4 TaxID=3074076 RepID=UPI0028626326|nr:DUF554 domain-containing protein [Serpentinicella sp. ANB-PHB4]MDR5658577.1 DUF554 domain-containing protein [Serpentinicella sp. ANB-PHB4]
MQGTLVNTVAIIIGGLLGVLLRKGIPNNYKETIMQGLGLCVVMIGLMGALKADNILIVIFSIVIGSIIGEALKIEKRLNQFGNSIEKLFGKSEGGVAKGFVTASLIYCVGAMAIVGALDSGLKGDHSTLYAKSVLDGISSIIFSSTLGIGVVLSAGAVFIYQGFIVISASVVEPLLTEYVIELMSAIGGLLILGIGLSILGIKKVNVANMLPAVFMPILFFILEPYFSNLVNRIF